MAGAGFKTFNTGDVLTASDVNTYLMQQTVMVFADSSARTTALGANVAEGMISYLKDTNAVEVYNGSAWVSSDDPNAIQNTIVDAKGDIITATAADTPARLAVGSNGYTLVADSSTSTGLAYSPTFFAGKNKIINGDFGIWQRGTSISLTNNTYAYGADRFIVYSSFSAGSSSFSQQTFAAGTAPVSGYEGTYFGRLTCGSTATYFEINQRIEDVRAFAGQTITFSFWAKASGTVVITPTFNQFFGSGGSSTVTTTGSNATLTTSWARYTATVNLPSISGKTIGTNSYLNASLTYASGTINSATIDIWGVQLEAGSTATQFQTATGTIQGELAACQRYLPIASAISSGQNGDVYVGYIYATNSGVVTIPFPTGARIRPTGVTLSGTFKGYSRNTSYTVTPVFNQATLNAASLAFTTGFTGTAGEGCRLQIDDGAYILFTGCEL